MRLSTSTNILDRVPDSEDRISAQECLCRCSKAGYKVMDMNFCDHSSKGEELTKKDWEAWVYSIAAAAKENGIEFSQSHTLFYNVCESSGSEKEINEELVRRAIIGSGMLGVKWIVMHAGTVTYPGYSHKESIKRNHEYFLPHIELAKKYNCGIAIENMPDYDRNHRQFTACTDELLELVDSFDDKAVGVCWDFGHAHLTGEDQATSLRRVGKRLKATHIADNHGMFDEHLAPFYGNIKWEPLMKVLSEIEYCGDFTFEIHNFARPLPNALRDKMLMHTVDMGRYLISKA